MRRASGHTPLAFAAILVNATAYLVVLGVSAREFMFRQNPAWAFYSCEACRQAASSYVTWGFMAVGLLALFVRRSEAVLVLFLVNAFLLIGVAWGPFLIDWHALSSNGGSILSPALHPLLVWRFQVTAGAVSGSALLGLPSVRRALSGAPATRPPKEANQLGRGAIGRS